MKKEFLEETIETLNALRLEMRNKSETRAVEVLDEAILNLESHRESKVFDSDLVLRLLSVVLSHLPEMVDVIRKLNE